MADLNTIPVKDFVQGILQGDKIILSRAITLLESNHPQHQLKSEKIVTECLPYTGNSLRIGITGVPGAGKSTCIETMGNILMEKGKKIAVLAIDPTSKKSRGSILGDKTRMGKLSASNAVFIRPTPAGKTSGGVAPRTRETILLMEAAGYDMILIETVGVGQSETEVHTMCDIFLLLLLSGAGDELQGIKRGIIEMADIIAINKADGDNIEKAKQTKMEMSRALHFFSPPESGFKISVETCSALTGAGMQNIIDKIFEYESTTKKSGYFFKKRNEQNVNWFYALIQQHFISKLYDDIKFSKLIKENEEEIKKGKLIPPVALQNIFTIINTGHTAGLKN